MSIIDTNIHLAHWPFRRMPFDDTAKLVEKLRREKISQAWAGSFDGILHKDIEGVNIRLAAECARFPDLLVPFGSVNPMLPDWEEDLRRCHEKFKMPGIRLHPNYHGYKLDHPEFARLLRSARERNLIVQIAMRIEDRRIQHPLMLVDPVDFAPLPEILKAIPGLKMVLLNCFPTTPIRLLLQLVAAGQVSVEIATLEAVGGVANLIKQLPSNRILFGSHAPYFILESALLKMKESDLSDEQRELVCFKNAQALLG